MSVYHSMMSLSLESRLTGISWHQLIIEYHDYIRKLAREKIGYIRHSAVDTKVLWDEEICDRKSRKIVPLNFFGTERNFTIIYYFSSFKLYQNNLYSCRDQDEIKGEWSQGWMDGWMLIRLVSPLTADDHLWMLDAVGECQFTADGQFLTVGCNRLASLERVWSFLTLGCSRLVSLDCRWLFFTVECSRFVSLDRGW